MYIYRNIKYFTYSIIFRNFSTNSKFKLLKKHMTITNHFNLTYQLEKKSFEKNGNFLNNKKERKRFSQEIKT